MMDEEPLNESTWNKIEETVRQILCTSDLETATELSIRAIAAQRLGFNLSAFPVRQLIRQLIDSYLLFTAISIHDATPDNCDEQKASDNREKRQKLNDGQPELHEDGKVICQLSDRRRVLTYKSNGKGMVSIRDFFVKDGQIHHRKGLNSGVCLSSSDWSTLRNNFSSIEESMAILDSRVRTKDVAKKDDGNIINPPTDSAPSNGQLEAGCSDSTKNIHSPKEIKQTESTDPSALGLVTTSGSQEEFIPEKQHTESGVTIAPAPPTPGGEIRNKVNNPTPAKQQLIPLQPCRLDGRNYYSWRHQMELFLIQLNLSYVLVEPRQAISMNPDEKLRNDQKWVDDDYLCRGHILNSLCDSLFNLYSQKSCSARDLWEELKLAYDEDFGTKISEVSKYINFQMIDGVPVLDQVQEIGRIADSIIASGSWIDENFHVSTIISKLPPAWKEFRVLLMCEAHLPLNVLMRRIQVEEEARRHYSYERTRKSQSKSEYLVGMKRKENKRGCYGCGKEGHINKYCPNRKSEAGETSK